MPVTKILKGVRICQFRIPVSSGILPDECIGVDVTIMENDPETTSTDAKRLRVSKSWLQDEQWVVKKNGLNPKVIAWKPKSKPYQMLSEKNKDTAGKLESPA